MVVWVFSDQEMQKEQRKLWSVHRKTNLRKQKKNKAKTDAKESEAEHKANALNFEIL